MLSSEIGSMSSNLDRETLVTKGAEVIRWLNQFLPHGPVWMGKRLFQGPLDLFSYQELMCSVKPTLVIETGTCGGSTLLYLSDIYCMMVSRGLVAEDSFRMVSVDIVDVKDKTIEFPEETKFIINDSVAAFEEISMEIRPDDVVMVLLDSDHAMEHVFNEMLCYGQLVTVGSYMIVEDSWLDVLNEVKDGPCGAIEQYLRLHDDFEIDYFYNRWILSLHPKGYLKKMRTRD